MCIVLKYSSLYMSYVSIQLSTSRKGGQISLSRYYMGGGLFSTADHIGHLNGHRFLVDPPEQSTV